MPKSVFRKAKDGSKNSSNQENYLRSVSLSEKLPGKPSPQIKLQSSMVPYDGIFANCKGSEYFNSLKIPTHDQIQHISASQERKELEIMKRISNNNSKPRNHSSRRFSEGSIDEKKLSEDGLTFGLSMSPTDRWVEAVRELCYRKLTWPYESKNTKLILGKENYNLNDSTDQNESRRCRARHNWKNVGLIARRAGRDEDPVSEAVINNKLEEENIHLCIIRQSTKDKLRRKARLLGLQYFLEMVDPKHRYGPNLRIYHEQWKKVDSLDNFFLWLDFGEGLHISCQACPRERLEREQVRYLSKEERSNYLVALDRDGRLCWAKNGTPVDTSVMVTDTLNEIVPAIDYTTRPPAISAELAQDLSKYDEKKNLSMNSSSFISSLQKYLNKYKKNGKYNNTTAYATAKLNRTSNAKIIRQISVATIIDRLLRGSVKKNTWIFVADTNFRIYVGMKQSGIFQHSSFLHGSRVSAAGSIKVIDGKLCELSPLSGHYRTPGKFTKTPKMKNISG